MYLLSIPISLPVDTIIHYAAQIAVVVLGPFVAKKLRDRNLRDFIATTADAALVLAISKWNGGSVAELIRQTVADIMAAANADPAVPNQLRNENTATQAVAAAVARAGITTVQKVSYNPDGTVVPVTEAVRAR